MRRIVAAVLGGLVVLIGGCSGSSDGSGSSYGESGQAESESSSSTFEQEAEAEAPENAGGGSVAAPQPPPVEQAPPPDGPVSADPGVNGWTETASDPLSTFATDVDTASYALARGAVRRGVLPEPGAVRVEEFVNALDGGYAPPADGAFSVSVDATTSPFRSEEGARLVRVGLRAADPAQDRRPVALTFVVDVSGSMADEGRLDLVRRSLGLLASTLAPTDTLAIVAFSDSADVRLGPTSAADSSAIRAAIDGLQPLGSTGVEAGLRLGYQLARQSLVEGGTNRVVLASDGIANTGLTDPAALIDAVRADAATGITLATVGVGVAGYSDSLMEQLADDGDGFALYVDSMEEAQRRFVEDLAVAAEPVAVDTKVQVEFDAAVVQRYRLVGYENRDVADSQFRDDTVDAGLVVAGSSVTALYEVVPVAAPVTGPATGPWGAVTLRWTDPDSRATEELRTELDPEVLVADGTSPHLRLAATSAAFAEVLRQSFFAADLDLGGVAAEAEAVAASLPTDPRVRELADLVAAASAPALTALTGSAGDPGGAARRPALLRVVGDQPVA